jgi:hypothetical protein
MEAALAEDFGAVMGWAYRDAGKQKSRASARH